MEYITLNKDRRLVVLKFSVANREVLPLGVLGVEERAWQNKATTTNEHAGITLVEPRDRCSLHELLEGLEVYHELADAFCIKEPKREFSPGRYVIQFTFCERAFVRCPEHFAKRRHMIHLGLKGLCGSALWVAKIYSNPHFENGARVPGVCSASINCDGRTALLDAGGKPLMEWQRDAAGKPLRDLPKVPLAPKHVLRLTSNVPELAAAD